ncbi:MAG TPA: hypothetical protein DEF42_22490 [Desulfosporosinus sp.]|nr:hypothetical protein [Desulfosporosinus sp.]
MDVAYTNQHVDKPLRTCTLHTDDSCIYWIKKGETSYKGLGHLKRDGGWLSFNDEKEAVVYKETSFPKYQLIDHC